MFPRALPVLAASVITLTAAGCASDVPKPDAQLDAAQAAITQAESDGAAESTAEILNEARDKVDKARHLMKQESYAPAKRLLEQATADARLAGARARTAESKQQIEDLNAAIDSLENRIDEEQT